MLAKRGMCWTGSSLVGGEGLNPRPHGPELCELSSRNVVNDRIQFDSAEAKSSPRPVRRCFARLLDEVLHDPPREDDLVWNRSWVEERPARLWKSRSLDRAFEPLGLGVVRGRDESIAELFMHKSPREQI